MKRAILAAALLSAVASAPAFAGSVSGTLSIVIQAPLTVAFSPTAPTVPCGAAPGTFVASLSTSGGNGNAASFALTGGDQADFAISGSNIVVGSSGIAAASCDGKSHVVTVTATQQ